MSDDNSSTLSELKVHVRQFKAERDWTKYHTPRNIAESISIEAAELLELFQWLTDDESNKLLSDPAKKERLKDELADVMIYCISMADATGIDLAEAIMSKIEKNKVKYPVEKVKGTYKKYSDL